MPHSQRYLQMDFSPDDGKWFGVVDANGIFCIWDVKQNRLAQFNTHLKDRYTCFVWLTVCTKNNPKFENITGDRSLFAALGKANGGVDFHSCETGNVELTLDVDGHEGAVTLMSLYENSQLGMRCWRIGTSIPTCMVSLPGDYLMIGCKELFLWFLSEEDAVPQLKSQFNGHSTDVSSMKVVEISGQNQVFVLTTAVSSREIYLWNVDVQHNPHITFVMEYATNFVSCRVVENRLIVTAVTQSNEKVSGGAVHLFIVDQASRKTKEVVKPNLTMALESHESNSGRELVDASNVPIVAATLDFGSDNHQRVLIAYGGSRTPAMFCFEEIDYDLNEKEQTHNIEESHALDEALLNHDADLLRRVLLYSNDHVINETLKRLPTTLISRFVEEVTWLVERHIANGRVAALWLKQFLRIHNIYLMSLDPHELHDKFGSLLGIMKTRNRSLVTLSKLSGQLEFLYNQTMWNPSDNSTTDEYFLFNEDVEESLYVDTVQIEHLNILDESSTTDASGEFNSSLLKDYEMNELNSNRTL